MGIADVDGSGTIDFAEFLEFINKLEDGTEEQSTEEGLKTIFDSMDSNGNGELDEEEFGKALFEIMKPEAEDEDVE
jgi:Ca2+-binding EF-hand superfamily protein